MNYHEGNPLEYRVISSVMVLYYMLVALALDSSLSWIASCVDFQDELEITSKVLGQRGGYSGTVVLFKNKATGEVIAEGRHSLFNPHATKSKLWVATFSAPSTIQAKNSIYICGVRESHISTELISCNVYGQRLQPLNLLRLLAKIRLMAPLILVYVYLSG